MSHFTINRKQKQVLALSTPHLINELDNLPTHSVASLALTFNNDAAGDYDHLWQASSHKPNLDKLS